MPPLAMRFLRSLLQNGSPLALDTAATLACDFECFEVSAIVALAERGAEPPTGAAPVSLPAAGCWVESFSRLHGRRGLLLTAGAPPLVDCTVVSAAPFGAFSRCEIALSDTPEVSRSAFMERQGLPASFAAELVAILAWIADPATPRRQHRPPLWLDRRMRHAGVLPPGGRAPGWSEIIKPRGAATRREAA